MTAKPKMANFANLKPNLVLRARLEKSFLEYRTLADSAAHVLRVHRVHAGQILLELKTQFAHGDWLPYLSELCERAQVPDRTARQYMKDAQDASTIPAELLAEAKLQGWDITTRRVRNDLVNWLLEHPDMAQREPKFIIKYVLGTFVPPPTAEQQAAEDAERKSHNQRWEEFAKFRETHPDPNDAGYAKYKEFAWHFPDPAEDAAEARERAQQAKWSRDEGTRKQQEYFALQIIDAGFKALAKKHHPDVGGKKEDFQLLKEAANLLKASLNQKGMFSFSR